MLIAIAIVLASIIPSVVVGAVLAHQITERRWVAIIAQAAVGAGVGFAAVVFLGIPSLLIIATAAASQTLNLFDLIIRVNNRRQRNKALDGDYGEVTQWAAEIAEEGDQEFIMAINALPNDEKMELGIIADDKEQLRELVVERFDELAQERLPEDFA